jgi:hypothetical protein
LSYVILTSKDGIFRTEGDANLRPVETWDYIFYGQRRARFVVAEVLAETRVRIIDEQVPPNVNLVPSKLLEHFASLEAVRRELASLTTYGTMDTSLRQVA